MISEKWKYSPEELKEYKKRSIVKEVWRNYKKSPSAMMGLVILVVYRNNGYYCTGSIMTMKMI